MNETLKRYGLRNTIIFLRIIITKFNIKKIVVLVVNSLVF